MACHGGSIGGKSYVGLGNTQVDYDLLFRDLFRADGRRRAAGPLHHQHGPGHDQRRHDGRRPPEPAQPRPLPAEVPPAASGANLPELDAPAWWNLKHKKTMYYDGRTPAASVRANMQFLLGEKTLEQFKALEPTFRDIQAYLLSLEPPKYPFPIDAVEGRARQAASSRRPAPAATAPTARTVPIPARSCRST